jgi:hypothetical protein
MTRADANPAKNPKLIIAYGFEYQLPGGNRGTGDPGPNSTFYRTLDHALQQQDENLLTACPPHVMYMHEIWI